MGPAKRKEVPMDQYSGRIARRMRELRDKQGMSVADIVEALERDGCGMTESAYRHWENGTRVQPVNVLPLLAKVLGVKLHDLLPKK